MQIVPTPFLLCPELCALRHLLLDVLEGNLLTLLKVRAGLDLVKGTKTKMVILIAKIRVDSQTETITCEPFY